MSACCVKSNGSTISPILWTWPIHALARRGSHDRARGARVWYSHLELLVMTCKQMAVSGHHQATRLLDDISDRFGPQDSQHSAHGFLVVPQKLTEEEWVAKYSPKDDPPDINEYGDD